MRIANASCCSVDPARRTKRGNGTARDGCSVTPARCPVVSIQRSPSIDSGRSDPFRRVDGEDSRRRSPGYSAAVSGLDSTCRARRRATIRLSRTTHAAVAPCCMADTTATTCLAIRAEWDVANAGTSVRHASARAMRVEHGPSMRPTKADCGAFRRSRTPRSA